jgi:hypothetical protein
MRNPSDRAYLEQKKKFLTSIVLCFLSPFYTEVFFFVIGYLMVKPCFPFIKTITITIEWV